SPVLAARDALAIDGGIDAAHSEAGCQLIRKGEIVAAVRDEDVEFFAREVHFQLTAVGRVPPSARRVVFPAITGNLQEKIYDRKERQIYPGFTTALETTACSSNYRTKLLSFLLACRSRHLAKSQPGHLTAQPSSWTATRPVQIQLSGNHANH